MLGRLLADSCTSSHVYRPLLHADLRQILQRTTSIKDLPKNIWKAGNAMTCEADSLGSDLRDAGAAKGRNKLEKSLLSGSASLTVEPIASDPGWVNVQLTSKGSGWLGFGVAQAGKCNHDSAVCASRHPLPCCVFVAGTYFDHNKLCIAAAQSSCLS